MKIVMLDALTVGTDVNLDRIEELGEFVKFDMSTPDEARQRLASLDADIVIANKVPMNAYTLEMAANVKLICLTATGYNNVDLAYTGERGITVTNVAGYSTNSVVQHTFAMMFYLVEKMRYYDDYVKSGAYADCPIFTHFGEPFHELYGMTWGIIGLGTIGRKVAQIAESFGCNVIYYSTSGHHSDEHYRRVDFDELLAESDIISIHAPLNENTKGLMDINAFSRMKKSAVMINVGRGPIVVEKDLVKALNDGMIAAAGLDVLETEPVRCDNPLLDIKDSRKLLITPHSAWATTEARQRLMDEVAMNITAFVRGEARNVISG